MGVPAWLDPEPFRRRDRRTLVVRRPAALTVVLGSSQDQSVVDHGRAAALGIAVARRRTGGGLVLVEPDDSLLVDAWIPAGDPLADDDVLRAAAWVGSWWRAALGALGAGPLEVHAGRQVVGPWGDRVCFAGTGAGEVVGSGRKVVGVAQWRSRRGALLQSMAYRRWDPAGLDRLLDGAPSLTTVEGSLLEHLPPGEPWDVRDDGLSPGARPPG